MARCHRLTAAAYAVQHRGDDGDPHAGRSVWLHVHALDAVIGRGLSHETAWAGLRFPSLPAATSVFAMTCADVVAAGKQEHAAAVTRWAAAAAGWAPLLAR